MQTPVFKEPGSSGHGVVPKDHGLLAELFLPDRRKINTTTKRAMNFVMLLKKGCQSVATLAHTITDRLVYLLILYGVGTNDGRDTAPLNIAQRALYLHIL